MHAALTQENSFKKFTGEIINIFFIVKWDNILDLMPKNTPYNNIIIIFRKFLYSVKNFFLNTSYLLWL